MGVLWVAEHLALGSEVVVKFLGDELKDDRTAAKRIAREAATAARVRSPHVVQVFDHGVSDDGVPFIVMELLTGSDLRTHLETHGALSTTETTAIVRQLAKALAKTHAAGIVHRDVKPSNVFLCESDGEIFVKLLDFGLAQKASCSGGPSTSSLQSAGTPHYMSPEQVVGRPVDARSDVWALGAVAFECLTGTRAFEGETIGAFALAIHTLSLPSLTRITPSLPAAIDAWFWKACARAPDERFGSATEAADALAIALGTEALELRRAAVDVPPTRDPTLTDEFALTRAPAGRTKRSVRGATAWIAAALAIAAANVVWGAYRRSDRSPEATGATGRIAFEAKDLAVAQGLGSDLPPASPPARDPTPDPLAPSPTPPASTTRRTGASPVTPASAAHAAHPIRAQSPASTYDLPDERY